MPREYLIPFNRAGSLPVTELQAAILSLPMYPQLTDAEVSAVIAAIRRFYA